MQGKNIELPARPYTCAMVQPIEALIEQIERGPRVERDTSKYRYIVTTCLY